MWCRRRPAHRRRRRRRRQLLPPRLRPSGGVWCSPMAACTTSTAARGRRCGSCLPVWRRGRCARCARGVRRLAVPRRRLARQQQRHWTATPLCHACCAPPPRRSCPPHWRRPQTMTLSGCCRNRQCRRCCRPRSGWLPCWRLKRRAAPAPPHSPPRMRLSTRSSRWACACTATGGLRRTGWRRTRRHAQRPWRPRCARRLTPPRAACTTRPPAALTTRRGTCRRAATAAAASRWRRTCVCTR